MKKNQQVSASLILTGVIFLLFALLSTGCTVTQEMRLKSGGSGSAEVHIKLHPFVVRYVQDLQETLSGPESSTEPLIFDLTMIREAFELRPGIYLSQLSSLQNDELSLELIFDNVNDLVADPETEQEERLLTFRNTEGTSVFKIVFSRSNFHNISELFSVKNELLSVFVPATEEDFFSEEEYLELFEYAFEEYAENQSARRVLEKSRISVTVHVDGRIVSQTGGAKKDQSVVFEIPVLKLVTLEQNLVYEVQWK
jgi:hypothetical protein